MCDIQTICIETDDFEYYLAMKCEGYDDILLRKCLPVAKFQNIEAYRISEDGKLFSIVYVGDEVTEGDIKAKFENGTLTMTVPKKEEKPAVENKKYIAIEG